MNITFHATRYACRSYEALGPLTKLKAVRVKHCFDSFAVALEGPGWGKVLYSGDCRPEPKLSEVRRRELGRHVGHYWVVTLTGSADSFWPSTQHL